MVETLERNGLKALRPMRKVLISDEVIEQIKDLILKGRLKPGDKLPSEIQMASQMKVGRSTVREALKVLIHLGFIERVNKVAVVSAEIENKLNLHDVIERFKVHRNVLEMIEVRKIIEPDIAALAATRCDEKELKAIREEVQSMSDYKDDVEAFVLHDHRFHLQLAEGSRNHILIEIVKGVQTLLVESQGHVIRESSISPRSLNYHWQIYRAVEEGKVKAARKIMLEHLLDIEKEMYAILKNR